MVSREVYFKIGYGNIIYKAYKQAEKSSHLEAFLFSLKEARLLAVTVGEERQSRWAKRGMDR